MESPRGPHATTTPATPTTTYSVGATNATVTKNGAASSVSAIAVGDMIIVQGTVSGTSVTATKINDGFMMRGRMPGTGPNAQTLAFTGNGSPVIGGSVSAISGDTLTVTAKGGTAYTVDGTSASVQKGGATSTL